MIRTNLKNLCRKYILLTDCKRNLTTSEVSSALKPFYFAVHPDLFGQFPKQRIINENSLKQLNMTIESIQSKKYIQPISLPFYLKDRTHKEGKLRLINIHLKEVNIQQIVRTILNTCNLSTEYIDKILKDKPITTTTTTTTTIINNYKFKFTSFKNDNNYDQDAMYENIRDTKKKFRLKNWLINNSQLAIDKTTSSQPLNDELTRLKLILCDKLQLKDIRWECGWNSTHFRGCLLSFISLTEQHPELLPVLNGRILVFAPFTGISLDGHVMLNSGEVRHNWMDLLKNVSKYDEVLLRIPRFEKSVSQVLRDIKVVRRKFMPKILARQYEENLQQITTSLNDYLTYNKYPKQWPNSLNLYEIVVETEAGPLMVSPTGQFIVPCSLPGTLLVNFITKNLKDAENKIKNYLENKHIEKNIHQECITKFHLLSLRKDDNVTPNLMIQCCNELIRNYEIIAPLICGLHLNITTYYSVLSDGVVCIPWNWKL